MSYKAMLLQSLLQSRQCGKKCHPSSLFSLLLEQYESSVYDEYGIEGEEEGSSVPPLACEFSKEKSSSHILGLVDENGYVVIYNTNRCGHEAIVKDWRAHSNAIFDLAWMRGENKLLTAAGDQTIVLWDVTTSKQISSFQGHTSSVRSVNFKTNDSAVFATGSRDGHVMVWDKRCNKKGSYSSPVQVIRNAHTIPHILKAKKKSKLGPSRDSQQSVTIVVYQSDTTLLSAGAVDGCIKMWDLRKNYNFTCTADPVSKHTFNYSGLNKRSHGYSSLVLDSSCTQLFASCTDDIIYQYDLLSLQPKPVAYFKGHQNKTFYVKAAISPDDKFLLSGSSNENAYIWRIDKPNESPVVLRGHNAEVTDVSWNSHDFTKLATLSDDNTMRLWRLNRRLSPREPREITGYSERTHREIGITASHHTPGKVPATPKTVSPSILSFLNKSAQKTCSDKLLSNSSEKKQSTATKHVTGESEQTEVNSRVSCKRKLVCDGDTFEENPSKRQNTGDLGILMFSPNKASMSNHIREVKSPWKSDENPEKWLHCSSMGSPIGSPRRKCGVLKESSPNTSSKTSGSGVKCVPAHVKTKLFERTQSSTLDKIQSPTLNLPNLVMEGTVKDINVNFNKCDKENSPQRYKLDWLTRERLERETKSPTLSSKNLCSPRLNKAKSITKESSSPKLRSPRLISSSPRPGKRTKILDDSQEETDDVKQTPPKGMKSIKSYFSVKQ